MLPGFQDIITHIKQQEQRIMSLEQQNKDLKWKVTVKEGQVEFHKQVVDGDHFIVKEKFKKLEEENKKLKEENENLENMLGESYSKHDIADLQEENKKLKEKYEEGLKHVLTLTDEKKQLEEELEIYKEELSDAHYQYERLKDENKKLKEQKQSDFWENHQLRKENIKLKQDDPVEKEFKDAMEDLEKKVKELGGWSPTSSKQPVQDQ